MARMVACNARRRGFNPGSFQMISSSWVLHGREETADLKIIWYSEKSKSTLAELHGSITGWMPRNGGFCIE